MAVPSLRLADGSAVRLVSQLCQFSNYIYVRDEDGNEQLSTNPAQSISNSTSRTVRTASGAERVAVTR